MALGLFKKQHACDLVLTNGNIFTQNPDQPWADTVYVTDGKIDKVTAEQDLDKSVGKNTKVIDLGGKYVYPGFIDSYRSPAMAIFDGQYLDLSGAKSIDEIVALTSDFAKSHPENDVIFGYGYNEKIAVEYEKAMKESSDSEAEDTSSDAEIGNTALDAIGEERPIVLLGKSTLFCWLNDVAKKTLAQTAEDEMVEIITTDYILNLFMPFQFEDIVELEKKHAQELSKRGITSVLNLGTPDYLDGLYQDVVISKVNTGVYDQRLFSSYYSNIPLNVRSLLWRVEQRITNCVELDRAVTCDHVNINLANATASLPFTKENLADEILAFADRHINILINCATREDLIFAYECLDKLSLHGKTNVVIASPESLTDEEKANFVQSDEFFKTWAPEPLASEPVTGDLESVEDVVDEFTIYGAEMLGLKDLGTIQEGKRADFAVFDENILDASMDKFKAMETAMTIVNGKVVRDVSGIYNDIPEEVEDFFE